MDENENPTAASGEEPTNPAGTPTPPSADAGDTAPTPAVPPVPPWTPGPPPPGWSSGQAQSHWWGGTSGPAGPSTYGPGGYGPGGYGPGGYGGGQYPPYGAPGWGWGTPTPPPRSGRTTAVMAIVTGVVIAAVAGGLVGHAVWEPSTSQSPFAFTPSNQSPQQTSPAPGGPQDAGAIAGKVDPGLVDVNTVIDAESAEGAGTGMVLTSTGEVLTNNHVVEGANKISVTDIGNGRTYNANVVGYDRSHDIAVLQLVGASGLQTVNLGNSSTASVGQGVVAVGNAQGAGGTPSYAGGSITALNQTITASDELNSSSEQLTGLIETNADIVSGDSGGPLVNTNGRVVGIDTAASNGYQFQTNGIQGYAIPINTAVSIAKQIESGQSSSTVHIGPTALLGVAVRSNNASNGGGFFGGNSGTSAPGALIADLLPNGPAAAAGLVPGDVITALGGQSISSAESLTDAMLTKKPGDTVTVTYIDTSGQQQTTSVTLTSGPAQ